MVYELPEPKRAIYQNICHPRCCNGEVQHNFCGVSARVAGFDESGALKNRFGCTQGFPKYWQPSTSKEKEPWEQNGLYPHPSSRTLGSSDLYTTLMQGLTASPFFSPAWASVALLWLRSQELNPSASQTERAGPCAWCPACT